MNHLKRVGIFCGSSMGARPEYAAIARRMGHALARRGLGLVYGGGGVGLMGVVADAALAQGAEVIGVIPRGLATKELAHGGLTHMHVVGTMHERKALMADLADAFIALPGGLGTLEELCEILTWAQLGLHRKPCGLLNVLGYFDPLLALLDHAVEEGFVTTDHRSLVVQEADPDRLLHRLNTYQPPQFKRWVEREET
ncbi:MAG: TIGR00730 family Rossman fold protein [Planctomycetes bacterium]|nr:TIGR00730 family Rossman fold protein [Planctomycetota bacterium]